MVEDFEHYQARERALVMLKLMAQGEHDYAQGNLIDQDEVFAALRQRLSGAGPEHA